MATEKFLSLQHSESVVAQMAATIFAAYIQTKTVTDANEDVLVEKAVNVALKLAERTENLVKSDQEWVKKEGGSSFLGG